jgi:hypothetical protein
MFCRWMTRHMTSIAPVEPKQQEMGKYQKQKTKNKNKNDRKQNRNPTNWLRNSTRDGSLVKNIGTVARQRPTTEQSQ